MKFLGIETINTCNRSCYFCKHGDVKVSEKKLPFETIIKICKELNEMNFIGNIRTQHINEPLLDDRIFDIIEYLRKNTHRDNKIEMTTNGDFLTKDKLDLLIQKGVTNLAVSAYTDNHFNKILELNQHYDFHIKDMRPNSHKMITSLTNRNGTIYNLNFSEKQKTIFKLKNKYLQNTFCHRPFQQMIINADGKIALCCEDMYAQCNIGSIFDNTVEELWTGEVLTNYRKHLMSSKRRKDLFFCNDCTAPGIEQRDYLQKLRKK